MKLKVDLEKYKKAFDALPQGVREAEVQGEMFEELVLQVKSGAISGTESYSKTALYLRASDEKTGTVYTEKLDEDPYEVISRAMYNSQFSQQERPDLMRSPYDTPLRIVDEESPQDVDGLLKVTAELEKIAGSIDKRVKKVLWCTGRKTTRASQVVNSKGLDTYLENTYFRLYLMVMAQADDGVPHMGSADMACRNLDGIDLEKLAKRAAESAVLKIGTGRFPSGIHDAVLSNTVTRNILATAWQEFVGTYMQRGSAIFKGEVGERIGSEVLNIIDGPSHPLYGYNQAIDCEGTLCKTKSIVKNGKLVTPLHNLESAALAGQEPTGNAGRVALMSGTIPINIITVPATFYIEPQHNTVEDLIAKMGTGIYLTYSLDTFHSINIASGEFSIPCGGVVYRDGEPVGTVQGLTMAGNLRELFANIDAVGDDLVFEEFIRKTYCYGGPSLLVRGITFAGQ
jgi:PmbA protein